VRGEPLNDGGSGGDQEPTPERFRSAPIKAGTPSETELGARHPSDARADGLVPLDQLMSESDLCVRL
jgi:hypothetical protein